MRRLAGTVLMLSFLILACEDRPAPAPEAGASAAQPGDKPAAPEPAQATPPEPAPAEAKVPSSGAPVAAPPASKKIGQEPARDQPLAAPAAVPAAVPSPVPAPAGVPAPGAAPVPTPVSPPASPAEPVRSLANNGHAAAGSATCKMCHRVQYASWVTLAHAKKGLDCEGCHGNGADYKALSVMKNPAASKAAGLIMPGVDFCRTCHGAKADASFLARAHAHKAK